MCTDPGFQRHRVAHEAAEASGGLSETCEALVPMLLAKLAADPSYIAELGALNRWPGRSALPLEAYLPAWQKSCQELGAKGIMAKTLAGWLV